MIPIQRIRLYLPLALYTASVVISVSAQDIDPQFQPQLADVQFSSRLIQPGDQFSMTINFRNAGSRPARSEYRVFVHFEAPHKSCEYIVINGDHEPTVPTTMWEAGKTVTDGPHIYTAPTDQPEQEYFVHIGVYDYRGTGQRVLETYDAGKIEVTADAPPSEAVAPPELSDQEIARRQRALANRISETDAVVLQADNWNFAIDPNTGAWVLTDRRTDVLWPSATDQPRFGRVHLQNGERTYMAVIDGFDEVRATDQALHLTAHPRAEGRTVGITIDIKAEKMSEPDGLRLSYSTTAAGDWHVTGMRLLEEALWCTNAGDGRVYVPHRLGIELPADKGLPAQQQRWTTYNNLSMAMCGITKQGSAVLVNWENVDTHLSVATRWPDSKLVPGSRMRAVSLDIHAPDGMCTVHPLGRGNYVDIAHAYRALAEAKGWLQTWADKRQQFPTTERIFGAADLKPFVFSRVLPSSRFSRDGKEHTHLGFTFDEVAECAEHWRHDLGIDRAFVVMAGWINGGYDVRHPDILPAAPECGGNEGLEKAIDRIKECGYLVGMHDNYQDMYKDAPSWDEQYINKTADGTLKKGGNWNGGQAYQVCAIKQVELAAREDTNLPKVDELFAPTIYFIDTVFAWPLVTCEDPDHPMTRQDDLEWKTRLCMLAKEHFGLFGSEEGREWAVPCADYLEGIFGHQTDNPPGHVIPLFQLVYSDCVQIMTHQGNRITAGDEKKMADHILFAQMHLPRFGNHLYWKDGGTTRLPVVPMQPEVRDLGDRKFEITYRWRVNGEIDRDYRVFVHFCHEAADHPEDIAYQNDHLPEPPTSQWQPDTVVTDGPHIVDVPQRFDGPAKIMLGMTNNGRVALSTRPHSNFRYHVGTVTVTDEGISYQTGDEGGVTELWSRGDNGWPEDLCITDRVIKNTWEVLSPLNAITADTPLTDHELLTEDRLLQRTRFGDLTITVSYEKPAQIGDNRVPPYGFIIESPNFVAFCATRYNGMDYASPVLFTARSLDGKPIAQSSEVRIYHGFGDKRIKLGGKVFEVGDERIVSME